MQLLVLHRATAYEVVVAEAVQPCDFRRDGLEQRTGLAKEGEPVDEVHVRNTGAGNEAALCVELRCDAVDGVLRTEPSSGHIRRKGEQRCAGGDAGLAREAVGVLSLDAHDAAHQPSVNAGDAVVAIAFHLVGVHQPDAALLAHVALHPQHVEHGRPAAIDARLAIVDRREQADVEAVQLARELRRRHGLRDAPRVDQPTGRGKLLLAFEKERSSFGEEDLHAGIVGELRGIGLDLREVRVGRAGQREVAGDAPSHAAAKFGPAAAVAPSAAGRNADC